MFLVINHFSCLWHSQVCCKYVFVLFAFLYIQAQHPQSDGKYNKNGDTGLYFSTFPAPKEMFYLEELLNRWLLMLS